MKRKLNDLITGIQSQGDAIPDLDITGIATHSDSVTPGDLYIAIPGFETDGHQFVPDAIEHGASAIITNGRNLDNLTVPQIKVANPRRAASWIAAEFYDHPSRDICVVGITGTNGKTTTAVLLTSILKAAGFNVAQMGTLGTIADGFPDEKTLTTLDPVPLQESFYTFKRQNFSHVVMEVSSHAIHQYRVADVNFDYAVFTNLSPEHLDYHGTMDEYFHAKAKFFKTLSLSATSIINTDNDYGIQIMSLSSAPVITTSLASGGDVYFRSLSSSLEGIQGIIQAGEHQYTVHSSLIGDFNQENILSAVATAHSMGLPADPIEAGIESCRTVKGRMETFSHHRGGTVIMDYAHTPDAYEKVLRPIRTLLPESGRITVIFGAGGNRDSSKRPLMAQIVERYSDRSFLTPDNPRYEEPETIYSDVIRGFKTQSYTVFQDRGKALHQALTEQDPKDVVVVLGKGREEYQDIQGEKVFYSDLKIIQEYCRED